MRRPIAILALTALACSTRTDLQAFDTLYERGDDETTGGSGDPTAPGDPNAPGDPTAPGDPNTPGDPNAPGDPTAPGDPGLGDPGSRCPPDAVWIAPEGVCIDRFEASNASGTAASIEGATPWINATWTQANDACVLAGKALCPSDVWLEACQGPDATAYPYGDTFDPEACNGLDHSNPVPQADTGSFPGCEGGYPGLFDMSGNVEEWTGTCNGGSCDLALSSFNSRLMTCDSIISMGETELEDRRGFRCCTVP